MCLSGQANEQDGDSHGKIQERIQEEERERGCSFREVKWSIKEEIGTGSLSSGERLVIQCPL